jgi:hypothetical protein
VSSAPTARASGALARAAVVSGRRYDEGAQRGGARDGPRLRAVLKGGVRLHDGCQRDVGRVVDVTVSVRVDGPLETRDELVAAPQHRVPARASALPAEHADGQDARPGRDTGETGCAARSDDEPGHARPVRFEARGVVRMSLGIRAPVAVDDVPPAQDPSLHVRMAAIHPRVEQGDRHSASIESRQRHLRTTACTRPELGPGQGVGAHGRRIDGPNRVDARNAGGAFELRHRPWVEQSREAVQRAREDEVPLERDASTREPGQDRFLLALRLGRPAALVLRARPPLGGRHAVGKRGSREHDEHPALEGGCGTIPEDRLPSAGRGPDDRVRRPLDGADESKRSHQGRGDRQRGCPRQPRPPRHMHREQDTADSGSAAQSAPQRRSWLRYRYKARWARGPRPAGRP